MEDYDLRELSEDPSLAAIMPETREHYKRGLKAGERAENPPLDLNNTKQKVSISYDTHDPVQEILESIGLEGQTTQPIPDKFGFREGYLKGLQNFIISQFDSLPEEELDFLRRNDGLLGLVRGMIREPIITISHYEKNPLSPTHELEEQVIAELTKGSEEMLAESPQFIVGGYALGFVVGIARDYNFTAPLASMPFDGKTYKQIMDGIKGKEFDESLLVDNVFGIPIPEESQDQWYRMGLNMWLHKKGLGGLGFNPVHLREPESLNAFKAAMEGRTIEDYETRIGRPLQVLTKENMGMKFGFGDETTPEEAKKIRATRAYMAGKAAKTHFIITRN